MHLFPNSKRTKEKLVERFAGKRILEVGYHPHKTPGATAIYKHTPDAPPLDPEKDIDHDLTTFPWPIEDNAFDLIICQHVMEHLPDVVATMEEFNRIVTSEGQVFIEASHYTCFEVYRHHERCHHFSVESFDYFLKSNPQSHTDFHRLKRHIFFDSLSYLIGIGFFANICPHFYEKRLAFIFPASSFYVIFSVEKEAFVPETAKKTVTASTMA